MLNILASFSLLCLLLSGSASANTDPLNKTMGEMGDIMVRLVPWAYSEDVRVPVQVTSDIDRLSILFARSSTHFQNQPIGVKINYDLLNQQLAYLSTDAKVYGGNSLRMMLTESFALCMSCHSQDDLKGSFLPEDGLASFAPGFIKAEYLFMVRNYEGARREYLDFLKTNPALRPDPDRIIALERILVLVTRPDTRIDIATGILAEASSYAISPYESRLLKDWQSALKAIAEGAMTPIDPQHLSIKDFTTFIEQRMPDIRAHNGWQKQQVFWVTLRNNLYSFINQHKQSIEMPRLLYWLALADRSLQYRFYDELSRLYLLECITSYPDHPYARQCFDEYELLMIVSFSGSAGLTIPDEIQQELDKLRAIVYPQ